jgi:endo-1,4-beta-xylanase
VLVSLNNVIINGGGEDGIAPWRTQGGAMITQASEQSHNGENSLLVTGRTANWNGPVMDLPPLSTGRVYKGSVWVRLASGTPATQLNFTLKRTVVGGAEEYIQLGSAQVTASDWVELTGSFTHVATGTLQEHFLYIESIPEGAAASFYVDDLELAISQNALLNGDFESGTGGWFALGAAEPTEPPVPTVTIERSNAQMFSGSYSLLVSNREQQWHGPATNLNLTADNVYNVNCRVRLTAGTADTNAIITIKTTEDGEADYAQVDAEPATADGWTELSGVFIYDPTGIVTELLMYVHTESDTASYYTDACAVTPQ